MPAPGRFRRQVAPAYLRRNQEDVLTELPELVEIGIVGTLARTGRRTEFTFVRDFSITSTD